MTITKPTLAFAFTLALALSGAATTFAAENRDKFNLPTDAVLEGVALPTGSYTVEWQGSGANVEVQVKKGDRVLVTAQATLSTLPKKVSSDTATVEPVAGGPRVLTAMRFGGKTVELRFPAAAAQKQSPAGDAPVERASRLR